MQGDFDPELYLRLACERQILDPDQWQGRGSWLSIPIETAMALVAIGALETDAAETILDAYSVALSIRTHSHAPRAFMFPNPKQNRPSRQNLQASRVVVCEKVIDQPWGSLTIHYVSFGDTTTSLAITALESSPGLLISTMGNQGTQQTPITDDQGHTEISNFGGGGGLGRGYHGMLRTGKPLSKTTKWIEIDSDRIELDGDIESPPARIETIPESDPATRHLSKLMANPRLGAMHGPWARLGPDQAAIDVTIETFVAAGALVAGSKAIEDVHKVMKAWKGQPSPDVPEPWGSLIANRGRQGGPSGVVGVGTVTPPIDGTVICVDALLSSPEIFELHVSGSPDMQFHGGIRPAADSSSITWWAEDDRRNHYLGSIGSWTHDGSVGTGTIVYTPALDPAATELRILPTGSSERAVITVKLPDWNRR
jgi:hypothetical protein